MAHFAKLDSNNIVERVIVVNNGDSGGGDLDTEATGIAFCKSLLGSDTNWKQTSYNLNFRGNFAGIGYTYMSNVATLGVGSTDIFIPQQPFSSWSIGVGTAQWYPPSNPGDAPGLTTSQIETGQFYEWSETNYKSDPSTAWVLTHR